jgi:phosphotransferase system enzyme I (PtsP)
MALIGLGFRSISMAAASVGPVKAMIRELDVAALEVALEGMLASPHRGSLRDGLEAFAAENDVPLA